ncbi:hypothetical protein BDN72DRAFT_263769 [Pluteus cervinus]|uniref:Uncharacterized protein n=1 Tax=Pluteus cervinus TaxID=181527 RepID=A0ACD3AG34_9AGAR|nr:hypothetical protein BDN72DRAFT_263769 [Pluteus cervinus]
MLILKPTIALLPLVTIIPVMASPSTLSGSDVQAKRSISIVEGGNSAIARDTGTCDTGSGIAFCCDYVQNPNDLAPVISASLASFGVNPKSIVGLVVLTCLPKNESWLVSVFSYHCINGSVTN